MKPRTSNFKPDSLSLIVCYIFYAVEDEKNFAYGIDTLVVL